MDPNPERPASLGDLTTGVRKITLELRGRDQRSQNLLHAFLADKDLPTRNAILQTSDVRIFLTLWLSHVIVMFNVFVFYSFPPILSSCNKLKL